MANTKHKERQARQKQFSELEALMKSAKAGIGECKQTSCYTACYERMRLEEEKKALQRYADVMQHNFLDEIEVLFMQGVGAANEIAAVLFDHLHAGRDNLYERFHYQLPEQQRWDYYTQYVTGCDLPSPRRFLEYAARSLSSQNKYIAKQFSVSLDRLEGVHVPSYWINYEKLKNIFKKKKYKSIPLYINRAAV